MAARPHDRSRALVLRKPVQQHPAGIGSLDNAVDRYRFGVTAFDQSGVNLEALSGRQDSS
ncbi:hypothetical protein [Pseudorhodoplanes sp.]|uniref:hypothetical protein n=1 Tax=Pseudorhodoplanes sp. TaxID=1934341 RepID=UPI00391B6BC7